MSSNAGEASADSLPTRRLAASAIGLMVLAAAVLHMPPSNWHYCLLAVLPVLPLMPVVFTALLSALAAAAAIVALVFGGLHHLEMFHYTMAAGTLVLLLAHLAAGHGPVVAAGWPARYAPHARTMLALAAVAFAVLSLYRPWPLAIGVPWLMAALAARFALRAPTPSKPWQVRVARPAAMTFVSLASTLALLEAGARVAIPQTTPHLQIHALDRKYMRALRPGGKATYFIPVTRDEFKPVNVEISRQGLRDRHYGPKPHDEFRILLLGDSFIFGWATEVEESIPRLLEAHLAEHFPQARIRVINGGIGATGPWQQLGLLRERGFSLEPDLVIHSIFSLNDISDSLVRAGKTLQVREPWEHGRVVLFVNRDRIPVRLHIWLDRHSHLYNVLRAHSPIMCYNGIIEWANQVRGISPIHMGMPLPSSARRPQIETKLTEWYPELTLGFELLCEDVAATHDECSRRGIPYAAIPMPSLLDMNDDIIEFFRQEAMEDVQYTRAKALKLIEAFLKDAGFPTIDAWPHLDAHDAPLDLFYLHDGHYTHDGCRFIAQVIADSLVQDFPHLLSGRGNASLLQQTSGAIGMQGGNAEDVLGNEPG